MNSTRVSWRRMLSALVMFGALCALAVPSLGLPLGVDFEFGGSGAQPGQFADLRDMTFDAAGYLYTLEGPAETGDRDTKYPGNSRIQIFDNNGKFFRQYKIDGTDLGEKNDPRHLAVSMLKNVFVTYPSANLVREFVPGGVVSRNITIPGATALTVYHTGQREKIAVLGGSPQIVNNRWASVGGDKIYLIPFDGGAPTTITLEGTPLTQVMDLTADAQGNFYVLAATNALYKYSPDGKLLKTLGAQTNTQQAVDGSELRGSVVVDSKGNVYAMANDFLSRFDAKFTTVNQREVRFNWFEPWGVNILALDVNDRLWAANPSLVTHPLFERFHFRPAIERTDPDFFAPDAQGVRAASALGIGLKPSLVSGNADNIAYTLAEFPVSLVIAPANRNVQSVTVEYQIFDAVRTPIKNGRFELPLKDGEEARAPLNFTPPRYGWYEVDVTVRGGDVELMRIGAFVGVTPEFAGMIKLTTIPGLGATNDVPRAMFTGLPNMRLNAGADPKSLDALDTVLTACEKYGSVPFVQFTDEKDVTDASVRAAVTRFKGRVKVWEIINEPNLRLTPEKYVSDYLSVASQIIREVDPQAKVMGPTGCGVNLDWYRKFYELGGGKLVDIISIHDYEGHEAIDPVHWRWKIGELRKLMAQYGDANKPIWQTERVITGVRGGNFLGLQQAIRLVAHRDLLETLDIAPDHNNHFYLSQMGYGDVPSYLWSSNGPHPGVFTLRTRYAMTLGRKYAGTLDFGPTGNQLFSALRYTGADGETIILRSEGLTNRQMTFDVRGGKTLRLVDAWGNEKTVPVRKGQVTLTVTQLPTYLRLAPGQSITAPKLDGGRNLATRATITYSARAERPLSLLNNGIVEVYNAGNPNGGTDGAKIWTGEMPELGGKIAPQYLELTFDSPRTFDRILLHGVRPDNQFSALRDYDIQIFDGKKWKNIVTARTTMPPSDTISTPPNFATSWDDDTYLYYHLLAKPVTASKVRIVCLRATYGFTADKTAADACFKTWGGYNKMKFMVREIEIFAPQSPVTVNATTDTPLKTAVFAPEQATITFTNSAKTTFRGTAKLTPPAGWTVAPASIAVKVGAGKTQTVRVQVTPSAELAIGPAYIEIDVRNAAKKTVESGWLRYDIASPVAMTPQGVKNAGTPQQTLTLQVQNTTAAPLAGVAKLEIAGRAPFEQPFTAIAPGKTAEVAFPVPGLTIVGAKLQARYTVTANQLRATTTQELGVRQWSVIGPFAKEFDTPMGPEKDLAQGVDVTKNFTDAMGNEQKWQVFSSEADGYVSLMPILPNQNVTAYAVIYATVPTARKAIYSAGTDDGGKGWLNGKLVFSDNAAHESALGQILQAVDLKAGVNEIMIKVVQGSFKWGYHFELLDPETGKPMTDIVYAPQAKK